LLRSRLFAIESEMFVGTRASPRGFRWINGESNSRSFVHADERFLVRKQLPRNNHLTMITWGSAMARQQGEWPAWRVSPSRRAAYGALVLDSRKALDGFRNFQQAAVRISPSDEHQTDGQRRRQRQ
jgi:hypothetical protein